MFKRELKNNFKSFIIWTLLLSFFLIMAYAFYPTLDQGASFDELLEMMPEELIIALNMDIVDVNSAFGWFASEGYMMVALLGGCYAAILGSTIVLKEYSEKTIEFLISKPISRLEILKNKLLVGTTYIFLFNFVLFLLSLISLRLLDDLDLKLLVLFSGSTLLIHYIFFFVTIFISMFFNKTKKMIGVSLGLVLGTYFLQVLSLLNERIDFLKYLSPYEYFSARHIILNEAYKTSYLLLTILIIILCLVGVVSIYKNKEFTL